MERTPFLSRSWRALCRSLRPRPIAARRQAIIPALEQLERRDCPTQNPMPDSSGSMSGLLSFPYSPQLPLLSQSDPLYVIDTATNEVLPSNHTPINSFASWTMNLEAQVSGATVSSYSWSFSNAPDATNISGSSTYAVQFTWSSSASYARNDTISVTETPTVGNPITQSYTFQITGTTSPGWSSAPTSASTWPSVIAPDQLTSNQETEPAGPYATVGLADGAVRTTHSLPGYNPNVVPLGLTYSSAVANAQPVFTVRYQLPSSLPTNVSAQLTITNQGGTTVYTGSTIYYDPSSLNPNDWMEIALQANLTSLATGRYNWAIAVTGNSTTNYSGAFNLINGSTTPTTATASPFGPGWSLTGVERITPLTGGVILQNPDGTSLWFANGSPSGTFVTPAGDFSTLVQNTTTLVYTRTLIDGTQINFNSSGAQTSVVDRDGNTTAYGYNGSGQLTSLTDMNSQVNTITYSSTTNLATSITDPAGRSLALAYNSSNQLTSLTDPDNAVWKYAYDSSNDMTGISDPRSTGSNYTTGFTINFADRATSVSQPDGTSESVTFMQLNGLATPGTGTSTNPAPASLWAGATAVFTDGRSNNWTDYLDGLGFGTPVEKADPLGDTSMTYRDQNGLGWLDADPLARRDRYYFNSNGLATKTIYNDDSGGDPGASAAYNSFGEATQTTDQQGGVATYSFNTKGDLLSAQNALGNAYSYAYNSAGLVTQMTDPMGHLTSYQYNSLNELIKETDPLGYIQSWAYTSAGYVSSYTNQNGVTITYSYDAMGRLTGETSPQSATVDSIYSYTYDLAGNPATLVQPLYYSGGTLITAATSYAFDAMNRLLSTTNPLSDVISRTYDGAGNLVGVTNALGNTLTYSFDQANRLTGVTSPLYMNGSTLVTATTSYTLDAAGEVTTETNPLNQSITYSFTALGLLSQMTDGVGNETLYSYGYNGWLAQVTRGGNASYLHYYYDAVGNLTEMLNFAATTSYSYNKDNQLTTVTGYNAGQGPFTYSYDADGRRITQTDGAGDVTTYSYDDVGNLTQTISPLGYSMSYSYDQQNHLLQETDALSGATSYTYNLSGWQLSETDPDGNTTSYSYNAAGLLTQTTNPNSYTASYNYDVAGELISYTDYNGRQTDYTYNLAGWKTGETWVSGGYTATYTYNSAGELTGAADPSSTYTYSYDANARLTQMQVSYPGINTLGTVTLSYSYNAFDQRTGMTDSFGGRMNYAYNNGLLSQMSLMVSGNPTPTLSFAYDTENRLTGLTMEAMGSGYHTFSATYSYDAANRLTGITDKDITAATTLATYSYSYNAGGLITAYSGPDGSLSYTYDHDGQLTLVSGAHNESYSYSGNGNRNSTGYTTTTGNEMTADAAGNTMTYDKDGNLATKTDSSGNVWTYTFDFRNRLSEVVEKNSLNSVIFTENLTYDVNNNLIGTAVNGVYQRWTVFDAVNPYMDFTGNGTLSERYLQSPTARDVYFAAVAASGTISWLFKDNLGSVREVVGPTGTVLDQITYGAFGNILSQTNSSNAPRFLYAGGEWDGNLALYRFGARWHDPVDGRWTSQDPLGLGPDSNPYRYTYNVATDLVDKNGMDPEDPPAWWLLSVLLWTEGGVPPGFGTMPPDYPRGYTPPSSSALPGSANPLIPWDQAGPGPQAPGALLAPPLGPEWGLMGRQPPLSPVPQAPPRTPPRPQNPDSIIALPEDFDRWHRFDQYMYIQGASTPPWWVLWAGPVGDAFGGTGVVWRGINSLARPAGPTEGVFGPSGTVEPPGPTPAIPNGLDPVPGGSAIPRNP